MRDSALNLPPHPRLHSDPRGPWSEEGGRLTRSKAGSQGCWGRPHQPALPVLLYAFLRFEPGRCCIAEPGIWSVAEATSTMMSRDRSVSPGLAGPRSHVGHHGHRAGQQPPGRRLSCQVSPGGRWLSKTSVTQETDIDLTRHHPVAVPVLGLCCHPILIPPRHPKSRGSHGPSWEQEQGAAGRTGTCRRPTPQKAAWLPADTHRDTTSSKDGESQSRAARSRPRCS